MTGEHKQPEFLAKQVGHSGSRFWIIAFVVLIQMILDHVTVPTVLHRSCSWSSLTLCPVPSLLTTALWRHPCPCPRRYHHLREPRHHPLHRDHLAQPGEAASLLCRALFERTYRYPDLYLDLQIL